MSTNIWVDIFSSHFLALLGSVKSENPLIFHPATNGPTEKTIAIWAYGWKNLSKGSKNSSLSCLGTSLLPVLSMFVYFFRRKLEIAKCGNSNNPHDIAKYTFKQVLCVSVTLRQLSEKQTNTRNLYFSDPDFLISEIWGLLSMKRVNKHWQYW